MIKRHVSVVQYKDETGVVVGWEILVDNQPLSTKLLIQDVLPITSFEYIPTKILAGWGERVIVFERKLIQTENDCKLTKLKHLQLLLYICQM